jgi:hypothetical protein
VFSFPINRNVLIGHYTHFNKFQLNSGVKARFFWLWSWKEFSLNTQNLCLRNTWNTRFMSQQFSGRNYDKRLETSALHISERCLHLVTPCTAACTCWHLALLPARADILHCGLHLLTPCTATCTCWHPALRLSCNALLETIFHCMFLTTSGSIM